MTTEANVLEVRGLRTEVRTPAGDITVVNGVDFDVPAGETVALVGESGSGKSLTALTIAGLLDRNVRAAAGEVRMDGRNLLDLSERQMRQVRRREISMIFQEPMTSLNPIHTTGRQVGESIWLRSGARRADLRRLTVEALAEVGLPDPERQAEMYPHQLSGGMRQRVMIAMALAGDPRLLIADEPTTALDVTTQAQILDLLRERTSRTGTAVMLITHDMGVVARYAHRVNVMYAGTIVERAEARALFARPSHPYTRGLLRSMPRLDLPRAHRLDAIDGLPPSPADRPQGCSFRGRCPYAAEECLRTPPMEPLAPGHDSACWRRDEVESGTAPGPAAGDAARALGGGVR